MTMTTRVGLPANQGDTGAQRGKLIGWGEWGLSFDISCDV